MHKNILQGHEARLKIKAGIDKACDYVRPTLGAIGMTAVIEVPGLDPIECDDGVTILKHLEFKDHYEQLGLQKLRKAAIRTSIEGGDGTATTTVLTRAIVDAAFNEIGADSSRIREIRERLQSGLKEVMGELEKIRRTVTEDDIERIAAISSLDPDIAVLIRDVIKEVGVHGIITVEKARKLGYSKEVVKGARFNKGFISPFFITDRDTESTVLEDPYIVLADRRISSNEQIMSLLNSIGTGKSILFIADDIDSVALGTLAQNASRGIARIACVKNPYSASRARDFLFDIAALTGGTVISEEMGMKLDTATKELCGRAEKVVVTRDNTMIIGGVADEEELKARVNSIEKSIEEITSEYVRKELTDRLAQLTGGIGVIRVGAYTDTEFNAKKFKFENAINAAQAALQEGILPGGGTALARLNVKEVMFYDSLLAPIRQMAVNAGMNPDDVKFYDDRGIDFRTKKEVNMYDAGIIDPFKVTRLALESAVNIACAVISYEVAITNEDEIRTN